MTIKVVKVTPDYWLGKGKHCIKYTTSDLQAVIPEKKKSFIQSV